MFGSWGLGGFVFGFRISGLGFQFGTHCKIQGPDMSWALVVLVKRGVCGSYKAGRLKLGYCPLPPSDSGIIFRI